MVLATAQGRTEAREGADFFPLTVDVEERMYAAGKIPGGFFKREGRPTERAILTARMIDRPIRPLWPKGFKNEVQVICTVAVGRPDHGARHPLHQRRLGRADDLAAARSSGRSGAVRIGMIDGELVVNPTLPELEEESTLDLIVVGTKDGLTMVEAGAEEMPEDTLLEALELAHARDQEALRGAGGAPARRRASRSGSTPRSTRELERGHGDRDPRAHRRGRAARGRRGRRGDRCRARPRRSRWTRPRRTSSAEMQVRSSLDVLARAAAARGGASSPSASSSRTSYAR